MTKAGELDRRITIERYTETADEFNEPIQAWATLMTVWAKYKDSSDLTKVEYFGAEQVSAFHLSNFIIRASAQAKTVNPKDEIVFDGRRWNIRGTKETNEGRNRFIELTAVRANN